MPKSKLHRWLPDTALPFATVKIGSTTYSDNKILSISISYGKQTADTSIEVPTCVVVIAGKLPIIYNAAMTVDVNIHPEGDALFQRRFTGRVGAQTLNDTGKYWTTEIIGTAQAVKLYQSNLTVYLGKTNNLAYIIKKVQDQAAAIGVPGFGNPISPALFNDEILPYKAETIKITELLSRLDNNVISVLHHRDGRVEVMHPEDRVNRMKDQLTGALSIRRNQALAPATHEQPTSYIDRKLRVSYYPLSGEDTNTSDVDDYYAQFSLPPESEEIIKLEDFRFGKNGALWKYVLRAKTYRKAYLAWQTPSITVDMLQLFRPGQDYYTRTLGFSLLQKNEGDFIIFARDWPDDLEGAKTIQGYTEKITSDSWMIDFSLADPRIVFGFSQWADYKPPKPAMYTWRDAAPNSIQGKSYDAPAWANIDKTKTWKGARRGISGRN